MSERRQRMLAAFADYERRDPPMSDSHAIVGLPLGTRLLRLVRKPDGWWAWLGTAGDYVYGTYLHIHDNGGIERITIRVDEGDEIITVRPSDEMIRRQS